MSSIVVGLIGVICFLLLLVLGMPIAYSMAIVGFAGFSCLNSIPTASRMLTQEIYAQFSSYSLSVIPMFMLMGYFAFYSGIGSRLYNFAYKAIGHLPGGLAIATQLACALFGAVCGSSTATAATIGSISLPEMRKYRYSDSLSTASVAAGAGLGIMIPPSVFFIIYGIATEQSIGKLFLAGILPGILLMLLFMGVVYIIVYFHPELGPIGPKATWKERLHAMGGGLWEIAVVFILSIGGLFAGWFTPTEAGAVGAAGVLVVTLLERKLKWDGFKKALSDTTRTTAMVMLMVAAALIFSRFMAISKIPFELARWTGELSLPPFVIMGFIIACYLLLGCFIDAIGLVLLTVPIFYPVVCTTLGYDPILFGVIIVLIVGMAVITPPVGMNAYIVKGVVPDVPLEVIFRGIWPFLLAYLICTVLLLLFPSIATFLPNKLF